MKGIEKLKKKIMGDADEIVKSRLRESRKERKSLQEKQRQFLKEYEQSYEERTRALVRALQQQSLAKARLEAKKAYLIKREEIINGLVTEVLEELDHSGREYEHFLKDILERTLPQLGSHVTIRCCQADTSLVKRLTKNNIIADDTIGAGLILEDTTGKRVDESISALLQRKKDEIRKVMVNILNG